MIRKVGIDDLDDLMRLGIQTFSETFGPHNTAENLAKYIEARFTRNQLLKEIANPDSDFYFAYAEDKLAGYLKLNIGQSQTELKEDDGVEIERIYVLEEFHGKKFGQALYGKALDVAQQRKAAYIWLGVWEKNQRAISFYKKNGFIEFDKHIFRFGNDIQTDIMMKKYCTD